MKIGLIRHFKVIRPYKSDRWMTSREYHAWIQGYDESGIYLGDTRVNPADWQACYASDLPRAQKTARHIYPGEIRTTPLLREITIRPPFETNLRLPFQLWEVMAWWAWFRGHASQVETRASTTARSRALLDTLLAQEAGSVLLVSHGGMIWHLRRELQQRGFSGDDFRQAQNGCLYIYQNHNSDVNPS